MFLEMEFARQGDVSMTIPFTFGWSQLVLLVLGLIGFSLLIIALTGRRPISEDELEEYKRTGVPPRRRRRLHIGRGISGIVLIALAVSLLWVTFVVQTYLGLTGDIRVAQVRALPVSNAPHQMSVELILYDNSGHKASDARYTVKGDDWMLEGDFVKFPTWLNILGLHTGYKLTRLEGRYDDPNMERSNTPTVVVLNGGDDNFFQTMHNQKGWIAPFVDATYGNAVFVQADGTLYDVFVSQTGLYAKPTG